MMDDIHVLCGSESEVEYSEPAAPACGFHSISAPAVWDEANWKSGAKPVMATSGAKSVAATAVDPNPRTDGFWFPISCLD